MRPGPDRLIAASPPTGFVSRLAAAYPGSCQDHEPLGHESSDVEPRCMKAVISRQWAVGCAQWPGT